MVNNRFIESEYRTAEKKLSGKSGDVLTDVAAIAFSERLNNPQRLVDYAVARVKDEINYFTDMFYNPNARSFSSENTEHSVSANINGLSVPFEDAMIFMGVEKGSDTYNTFLRLNRTEHDYETARNMAINICGLTDVFPTQSDTQEAYIAYKENPTDENFQNYINISKKSGYDFRHNDFGTHRNSLYMNCWYEDLANARIKFMEQGKLDINGQPINQNNNENTNNRSMGFTGVPLLAIISMIGIIAVSIIGMLIIK